MRSARHDAGSAQKADPSHRELGTKRLETPQMTLKKHFSPLNCTYSHFISKGKASIHLETKSFNEINDLAHQ
jgi:hypothetical protein